MRPTLNGADNLRRSRERWVIDFWGLGLEQAALYEKPFGHVEEHVKPARIRNRDASRRRTWWQHGRTGHSMRAATASCRRYLTLTQTAKHVVFRWQDSVVSPEQTIIAFARDDDYFMGILHSRAHGVWSHATGTQLREVESGFRYTPTTCFESFPFPSPTVDRGERIAAKARELNGLRSRWLNPPELVREDVLTFPASTDGPWARVLMEPNADGIGTARYLRLVPVDAGAEQQLKKRTLTNLYNARPTWLANAHRELDEAVFAAYGWSPSMADDELLATLLDLNLARSAAEAPASAAGRQS